MFDQDTVNLHMKALSKAFFENLERDNVEYGGWGLNDKRPFGNSDVEEDILEIVGLIVAGRMNTPGLSCDRVMFDELDESDDVIERTRDFMEYANGLYSNLGQYLKETYSK